MTMIDTSNDGYSRLEERADRGDNEARAAFVILSEPWARQKAVGFIDADGIDFATLLSAHDQQDVDDGTCRKPAGAPGTSCGCGPYLSGGEYRMLRLAWNLWNGQMTRNAINVSDLLDSLGDGWLAVAFAAIEARNGRPLPIRERTS